MRAAPGLFREEALAAHQGAGEEGVPLRLTARWVGHATWFMLAAAGVAVVAAALARVGDYAEGPAVVRAEGGLDLVTPTGGIVAAVEVEPGGQVRQGETLVRFLAGSEEQELARLDRERELKLVRLLLHPRDEATQQSLATLQAQRELVAARLREREVVAPRAGVVRNLRIRQGQVLTPGDLVLTLVDEAAARFQVVAFVPGHFRPMLRPGMPLRFALEGYPHASSELTVESVGDEVVGPGEARRYLGRELGDALAVQGSLVLVRGRLATPTFRWRGQRYRLYDGIPGRIDVLVRRLPLYLLLFSALEGR
jgi:multidrug resistance efflux pump